MRLKELRSDHVDFVFSVFETREMRFTEIEGSVVQFEDIRSPTYGELIPPFKI